MDPSITIVLNARQLSLMSFAYSRVRYSLVKLVRSCLRASKWPRKSTPPCGNRMTRLILCPVRAVKLCVAKFSFRSIESLLMGSAVSSLDVWPHGTPKTRPIQRWKAPRHRPPASKISQLVEDVKISFKSNLKNELGTWKCFNRLGSTMMTEVLLELLDLIQHVTRLIIHLFLFVEFH